MPIDFNDLTFNNFSQLHGGKRTKALAGQYRKRKGLSVSPAMQDAMQAQALIRQRALRENTMQQMGGPDQPPSPLSSKPLPEIPDMMGPPNAPKTGDRTKPGTTPMYQTPAPPGAVNWNRGGGQMMPNLGGPEAPPPGGAGAAQESALRQLIAKLSGNSAAFRPGRRQAKRALTTRLNKRIH